MRFQSPAGGLGPVDIDKVLMRAAGDHGAEAGVLLLIGLGDWLPQLSEARLIDVQLPNDAAAVTG